ncbi:MAG: hypothetical protein VW270_20415 [Candidatus Poseidoniales archaeon]
MKNLLQVIGVVLITSVFTYEAFANDNKHNNEMIKECLDFWGYDRDEPDPQKRLDSFDFRTASTCVANFRYEDWLQRMEADRELMKDKPWFRGSNWKWEERAEYKCTKQLHNGGLTVCHKPIYIN